MKYSDYPYLGFLITKPHNLSKFSFSMKSFESSPELYIWHDGIVEHIGNSVVSISMGYTISNEPVFTYEVPVPPPGVNEIHTIKPDYDFPIGFMLNCQNWSPSSYTMYENAVNNFMGISFVSISSAYSIAFYNSKYENVVFIDDDGKSTTNTGTGYFFDFNLVPINFTYEGNVENGYPFTSFYCGSNPGVPSGKMGVAWQNDSSRGTCSGYLIPNSDLCILALPVYKYIVEGNMYSYSIMLLEDMFHEPCSRVVLPSATLSVTGKLDSCGKFYFEIETKNSNRLEISCDGEVIEEIKL